MVQSWLKDGLGSITPGAVLYAVAGGLFCALLQFYFLISQADGRLTSTVDQLIATLEEPAARSVLILDSELAYDITKGLTKHHFVTEAKILEDHGATLAETTPVKSGAPSTLESMVAPVVGTRQSISKKLHLPESMSQASGEIILVYDRARGVAALISDLPGTVGFTFLVTVLVILAGVGILRMTQKPPEIEA